MIRTGSERVADSDSTSLRVDLLGVNADRLYTVQCLRCKRLVDLENVHISNIEAGLLQDGWDSESGANTHDLGWY